MVGNFGMFCLNRFFWSSFALKEGQWRLERNHLEALLKYIIDIQNPSAMGKVKIQQEIHHVKMMQEFVHQRYHPYHHCFGCSSGGETTITRFLGKDASLEWNTIHAPGTVLCLENRKFRVFDLGDLNTWS